MAGSLKTILNRLRNRMYGRKPPLILINGLAEQAESWYLNDRHWSKYFNVLTPNLLAFEGARIHERIARHEPITVDWLVEELHDYVTRFVQTPPYHVVASSLGGKIAVEFAAKYPEFMGRLVLICPSGMGDVEQLPIIAGVKRSDAKGVVTSVFHNVRSADKGLQKYYLRCFASRRWKTGFIKCVRGSNPHVVRKRLADVKCPTLFITGANDRIVDPQTGEEAARELPDGCHVMVPKCGHAPQIEKPGLINRLVVHFLTHPNPTAHRRWMKILTTPAKKQPRATS